MIVVALLIPIIMIGFGLLFWKWPPKTVNAVFGYRTSMSMKNGETWIFAHKYFGKWWFFIGLLTLAVTVVVLVAMSVSGVDAGERHEVAIMFMQMVPLLFPIIPTERALRRSFDINGRPKA